MGGGLCCFIDERWCNNHTAKQIICTPDVELLSIFCRPFYLPRELSTLFAMLLCVPPSANYAVAAEAITQYICMNLITHHPVRLNYLLEISTVAVSKLTFLHTSNICNLYDTWQQNDRHVLL